MSKQVDERVVSMQFDNKKFEQDVSTTMSTLDKLKAKLKFDGASKGLENVGTAAKKVDMSPLANGVETVRMKFSALQVIGTTALANITNSAVNAGKRMISALTIDPIKSGFQEYETQMNAVQTILANTQSKGSTLKDVNAALSELNTYADKTIYNFTEMTRNIGTFTAAGVDLDTSVSAIQGIANLAAVSGSTSQQASTAMYQLSQALAAGKVQLMDWNSVVNAGMGGQVFQDALKKTSELLGTGAEEAIKAKGSFRESLRDGWLTAEVLTETLKKFTTSGATEYIAEYTGLSAKAIEAETKLIDGAEDEAAAIDKAASALAKKSGKNKTEIKEALQMAYTAQNAATKVKTFTQLWDVLKEAAQSGWAKTWQLIIGDFEQAKSFLSPLADTLTGFINKMSDARNKLLETVMKFNPFKGLSDKLEKVTKSVETVTEATKNYGKIVDRVIGGEFGNGQKRWDALTEAGYDWAHVQNLVNEKLGDSTRHATNYKEAQKEVNKTQTKTIEDLTKMSNAQLENLGFTKKEIKAFRDLEEQSKKTGIPIKDLIKDTEQLSGRSLLLNSFKNIGQALVKVFSAIGKAWKETFNPIQAETLYDAIAAFHKFTNSLIMNKKTSEKLTKTFKGVFSIIKLITTITGGVFKLVFKVVSKVLEGFGLTILDVTAFIGEAISKFEKFITQNKLINKVVSVTASAIVKFIKKIKELAVAFWELDKVQNIVAKIKEIGTNIIDGLKKGLQNGIKTIPEMLANIGRKLLEAIKKVLGIHSPSKETEKVGTNIIDGLLNGLKNGASKVLEVIKGIGEGIVKFFKAIPWSNLFAAGISIALVATVKKLVDAVAGFASAAEGLGDMFEGIGSAAKNFGISLKRVGTAVSKNLKAKALKEVAIGIALLAASVWLLSTIEPGKLWGAIGAIAALAVIIGALVFAVGKMSKMEKGDFSLMKLTPVLLGMSVVLLILTSVIKKIGSMSLGQALQGFIGLALLLAIMIGTFKLFSMAIKGNVADTMAQFANLLTKVSISLILMVLVCKLVGKLSPEEMKKGAAFVGAFLLFIYGLMKVSKGTRKNMSELGKTVLSISIAMLLMVGVCKLAGKLSAEEMIKGAIFAAAFVLFIKALVKTLKVGPKQTMAKIGGTLLSISFSLLLMVAVCKLVGSLSTSEMIKGGIFIAAFILLIKSLVSILKVGKKEQIAKIGLTILAIAGAIAIMAGIAIVLGILPLKYLAKGIIAVGLLAAMMALMIKQLQGAKDVSKSLMMIAICIGVMAAAIAGLSFIDPTKLAMATGALMGVMGMFVLLIAVTKIAKNTKQMQKTLLLMVGVVVVLAGLLVALSFIPMEGILEKVTALGIIVIALSAAMLLISKMGKIDLENVGEAILALTAMVIPLAAFALALNYIPMDTIAGKKEALMIIAGVMIAMSVALMAIGAIGALLDKLGGWQALGLGLVGLAAILAEFALFAWAINAIPMDTIAGKKEALMIIAGVMTVMSLVLIATAAAGAIYAVTAGFAMLGLVGMLAILALFVGFAAALNAIPLDTINSKAGSIMLLTGVMVILTDLLIKLAIVGPLALIGVAAITAMTGLIVAVGVLATAVGALMEKFPALQSFLDTGLTVLIKLAGGIGEMVGAFINGALTQATANLPDIGMKLGLFMTNATPFIMGAKMIDGTVSKGIGHLAKAILTITAANLLEGIASFIMGGSGLDDFGNKLGLLGKGMATFRDSIGTFTDEQVKTVSCAAKSVKLLAEAADTIPNSGGWVGKIFGENDLGTFAAQFPMLGMGIRSFLTSIGDTFTDDEVKTVEAGASAVKSLAEAADKIPNSGGWVGKIVGNNDLGTFSAQFPMLGMGIRSFLTSIGDTFTDDEVKTVEAGSKAVAALANAAKNIPNEGGWWAKIAGDNDLGTFAEKFPKVGEGLAGFKNKIGTWEEADINTIKTAIKALKAITELGSLNISNLSTASSSIPTVMTNLAKFVKKGYDVNMDRLKWDTQKVQLVADTIKNIGAVNSDNVTKLKKGADNLHATMKSLASLQKKGYDVNMDRLKWDIQKFGVVKDFISELTGFTGGAANKFTAAVKKLANTNLTGFVNAFKSEDIKKSLSSAAKGVADTVITAIKSKATGETGSFWSAGKSVVTGFASGITDNTYTAEAKAKAMAKAAYEAAKEELDVNSPSKLFRNLAYSIPEGMAVGIDKMAYLAEDSAIAMAKQSLDGTKNAISKIADVVNSDIDAQPTIRPVLDLSDVKAGAGSIDGMFSAKTLSINTDSVGTISARMSKYQNGNNNGEVVNAIKALRKDISDMPRDSITIGGITYDDGSNINEAVKSLVRAARIERRV